MNEPEIIVVDYESGEITDFETGESLYLWCEKCIAGGRWATSQRLINLAKSKCGQTDALAASIPGRHCRASVFEEAMNE